MVSGSKESRFHRYHEHIQDPYKLRNILKEFGVDMFGADEELVELLNWIHFEKSADSLNARVQTKDGGRELSINFNKTTERHPNTIAIHLRAQVDGGPKDERIHLKLPHLKSVRYGLDPLETPTLFFKAAWDKSNPFTIAVNSNAELEFPGGKF